MNENSSDPPTRDTDYFGYHVASVWDRIPGLAVRRLTHDHGNIPIPRILPNYRVALSLMTQNRAWLAIGRRVTTQGIFVEGTTVLGQPDEEFDGEMEGCVDLLVLLMEPEFVVARFTETNTNAKHVELRDRPPRPDVGLLDVSRRLINALHHGLAGDELYCDLLMEALVTRVITLHATSPIARLPYQETLSPARLRGLIDFIEANLSTPLRLRDLAAIVATSRAHLARAFRRSTGISLHQYVAQRRLERAYMLLRETSSPLRVVAEQCGFADSAHFSKSFKKAFGATPSSAMKSFRDHAGI